MDLKTIMKDYSPMYPDTHKWEDTFKAFADDPNEMELVHVLMEELDTYGSFREPITLSTYEQQFDPEDEEPYFPHVMNGTHRMYAHYLSGLHEVQVQHGWQDVNEEYEYKMIETLLKFPAMLSDKQQDDLFDYLRSFKLTETIWVETDVMSSSYGQLFSLIWSDDIMEDEDFPLLETVIGDRLDKLGITEFVIVTKRIHSEQEDDDFNAEFKAANPID